VKRAPARWATKSARPIPIGAMKVARCFSAASMKMVKIKSAVRNISMNKPRTIDVSTERLVSVCSLCMIAKVSKPDRHHKAPDIRTHEGKQAFHNSRGRNSTQDLRDEDHSSTEVCQAADEHETEGHSWVEETAADAEEYPGIDRETESERKRDVQEFGDTRRLAKTTLLAALEGDVGCSESEEEEHEGAEELADELNQKSAVDTSNASIRLGRDSNSDKMTAHGIRLFPHCEGGPAGGGVYGGIALGTAGKGEELVLNWGLDVHGCVPTLVFFCVFVVLFLRLRDGGGWGWCQCRRCDAKRADSLMV
jgi:hypothetical protein